MLPRAGVFVEWLPIEHWAGQPRWPRARVLGLPGRVRGVLLRDWAAVCARRFGADAPRRLRAELGRLSDAVPDAPGRDEWLPVAAWLALTDATVDLWLDGDGRALAPLLLADATGHLGRVERLLARALGPERAYRHADRAFAHLFHGQAAAVEPQTQGARIRVEGHELYGCPTWRLLQVVGHRAALDLLAGEGRGEVLASAGSEQELVVHVRWA